MHSWMLTEPRILFDFLRLYSLGSHAFTYSFEAFASILQPLSDPFGGKKPEIKRDNECTLLTTVPGI